MFRTLSALVLLILAAPAAGSAQSRDPLGTRRNPVAVDVPDSLQDGAAGPGGRLEVFRVRGARVRAATSASAWRFTPSRVEATDSGGLAEVIRLLPASRPAANSRGETVFTVRGSPERHVQVTLDGIPLVVPWDERADLSLIPTDAVGAISIDRGVTTALAIPGALAGVVELSTRDLEAEGHRTRLAGQIGEVEAWQLRGLHVRRSGPWSLLAAASRRTREAFLLPAGRTLARNQAALQTRTNSDLTQTSLLARVRRDLERDGHVTVLAQVARGERGVPPESHLDEPRLWRLPETNRTLLGVASALHPADRWSLHGVLALDLFHQEIREFDDTTYTTPALQPGVDYETDDDRTLTARLRATRETEVGRWSTQAHLRATTHDESLVVDGPGLTYSQRILGLAGEWSHLHGDWRLRAGAGVETATTPDSGDKPEADGQTAPVVSTGVTRLFGWGQVEGRASRRSRFPSLRELYSGALGRFVPNPDLEPEHQNLVEVSALRRWTRGEVTAGGFAARTDGLIERQVVDADTGQFQRVNLDDVRSLGLELSVSVQPAAGLQVQLHHTILQVRADRGDGFVDPVEDRPDYMTQALAAYDHRSGVRAHLEWIVTGARQSADVNDPGDGLARLPAQSQLNLRLGYRYVTGITHLSHVEVFARVDNVFDAELDSQFGLPEAGRMVTAGARVLLD